MIGRSEGHDDRAGPLVLLVKQSCGQPSDCGGQGNGSGPVEASARHPASYGMVRVPVCA